MDKNKTSGKDLANLENLLQGAYFSSNPDEQDILIKLSQYIPKNVEVFFDIGASLGQYTKYFIENYPETKVVAVEADPDRFEILRKNCKKFLQSLEPTTVEVLNVAVSNVNGPIKFYSTGTNVSGGLSVVRSRMSTADVVDVEGVTLTSLLMQHAAEYSLIFVKMDIEGAEFRAIEGFSGIPDKEIIFFVEIHDWGDADLGLHPWDFFRKMSKLGYIPEHFKRHYFFRPNNSKGRVLFWNYFFYLKHLFKHWLRKTPYYFEIKQRLLKHRHSYSK